MPALEYQLMPQEPIDVFENAGELQYKAPMNYPLKQGLLES